MRHNIGDGSDLGRIDRQQAFLSSVIQEATKSSLLLRPDKLFRFLNATTSAMTTDKGLSVGAMKDIAQSVGRIGTDQIRFVKLPTTTYAARPQPGPVDRRSRPDLEGDPGGQAAPRDQGAEEHGHPHRPRPRRHALTVSPGEIDVRVTNDSGVPGLAKQAAGQLEVQGFKIASYVTGTGKVDRGRGGPLRAGHEGGRPHRRGGLPRCRAEAPTTCWARRSS